jgi:hypothetical protein
VREDDFYSHPAPEKPYPDWCPLKTPGRVFMDSSLVAVEQAKPIDRTVENRFHRLAGEWALEVRTISSLSAMVENEKYRQIVSMGWDAVPFLLHDLQQNNGFWFTALSEITKIRPFDPRDAGNRKKMAEAWIQWGKRKKLI